MTADEFRDLALALPGVVEGSHMGHPDFRAKGRIFATLHAGDRTGMVKVAPDEQRVLIAEHPAVFEPSSGAWGRQGCTNVVLTAATPAAVRGAMTLAWEAASSGAPAKRRTRRTAPLARRSRR